MPSRRQPASGKGGSCGDLLAMLSQERPDVAALFQSVIKYHLGGGPEDGPRERQSRMQKMILDVVENVSRGERGDK